MCLYTLYVFVICLSVQSSLGNDVDDAKYRILLKPPHHAPEPSNETAFKPTPVESYKVCDKAVTLQKVLGVTMSLLRQDLSEIDKTEYILGALKDLLKNTAGSNDEVMYKIDDLIHTLGKYRDDNGKGKTLRVGLDNLNSPMKILAREPTQLNSKIRLNYELPALTNSYCNEALLNIIKIAYQAYVSLAKNPICNLTASPELFSGIDVPDINPLLPDFLKPTPKLDPQPGIGKNYFPKNKWSPFLLTEIQSVGDPYTNPNNLVPNVDTFNPNSEKLPIKYKPVYKYHPNVYDGTIDDSKWSLVPQILNNLTPNRPGPNNHMPYNVRPSYHTGDDDNKIPLGPYFPQNPEVFPFDFTPRNPGESVYPYPGLQKPIPFPWQEEKPNILFGVKPHSNPLNPYHPDANPLIIPDVPLPLPWGKRPAFPLINPEQPNSNSKENPEGISSKYLFPPLPREPGTETPRYMPLVHYMTDGSYTPSETGVFEFPYQSDTPKPNNVFPVNPPMKYLNNPSTPYLVTNNDSPENEVYGFNLNPNDFEPDALPSPIYQFMPKNPTQDFKFKPKGLDPYTVQNPAYELEFNPDGTPVYSNLSPYNWIPKTQSAISPKNQNPFFSVTLPNTLQAPELKVIGFIREAIDLIEGVIPVMKFDPTTLYVIAQIKNILVQKDEDIEADGYATILEQYKKLINYLKQQNDYKQIIGLIDLPPVTNRPRLETKKVVELTYLVKRPQPVVYYPYYYVKYRLPYPSFVAAAQNLLREKPKLRMNPSELYENLLALSKVAETSPDLKTYDKKYILGLTFKSGSLVHAKLVGENGTLTEQLNVLRDLTSDLTADEILELNKEATNQIQLLATNSKTVTDQQTDNDDGLSHLSKNKLIKTVKANEKQKVKEQINPLATEDVSLRTNFPANNNQNDLISKPTTEPKTLEFTSFESDKLRNDILRGEYVGLPFSDNTVSTVNPLNGPNEPIIKDGEPINPAMYKLIDATLNASKSTDLRNAIQQNLMNSGGLANFDNEKISMNTGKANHQASINISNPKIMINSAENVHSLPNLSNTKTSLDVSSQQSMINEANNQVSHQASVNQEKVWTNQQNFYNSGGLINYDNQKISLNTGTGNRQDGVNVINPKVMTNKPKDSIFEHTRISPAPDQLNSMNFNPISESIRIQDSLSTDQTQNRDTIQKGVYMNPTESYKGERQNKGMGIPSTTGNINVRSPDNIIEQTTRRSSVDVGDTQSIPYSEKEEKANFIKNSVKADILQFENGEDTKLSGKGERNQQVFNNNNSNVRPWNNGINSHGLSNLDTNTFLTTGHTDIQRVYKDKMAVNGGNQNLISLDNSKIVIAPGPGNENAVSLNNNKWFQQSEIGNQGLGYGFPAEMAGQQGERGRQQNIESFLDTGVRGQQLTSGQNLPQFGTPGLTGQHAVLNQQNFANFGINPGLSGRQINRAYMIQNMPVFYKRPLVEQITTFSSPMPLVSRFTRPATFFKPCRHCR